MVQRRQRERSLFEVLLPDGHKLWPDWLRKIDTLLEHERTDILGFFQSVDGANVGMIQRGERFRFALEPGEPLGVVHERFGQDLDRNVSIELRVARTIDFAHPAHADLDGHLIRPNPGATYEGHGGRPIINVEWPMRTGPAVQRPPRHHRDVTDEHWEILEPFLPAPTHRADGRGRPWTDNRSVLNGILWVLRTGAPWADLPDRYPSYQTCHRRFQQWVRSGVLRGLLEILAQALHDQGYLDASQRRHHGWRHRFGS